MAGTVMPLPLCHWGQNMELPQLIIWIIVSLVVGAIVGVGLVGVAHLVADKEGRS